MDHGTFSVDATDAGKGERDWTPYEFYTTHYFHNGTRLECRMRLEQLKKPKLQSASYGENTVES